MPFLVEKKGRSENSTHPPIPFGLGAKERAEGEKTQSAPGLQQEKSGTVKNLHIRQIPKC